MFENSFTAKALLSDELWLHNISTAGGMSNDRMETGTEQVFQIKSFIYFFIQVLELIV